MLKAQKKISKKEMQEDTLVTMYFNTRNWIDKNKRLMSYIIGVPIAIIVVIFLYTQKRKEWNETATTMTAKVISYYDQGKYQEAINGVPQEGIQGLEAIVSEYGSTPSGELAKFYLANSYYALGNYDKALECFDDVSVRDKLVASAALSGEGNCYEHKGEYVKAARHFEKAASKGIVDIQAPDDLKKAALDYALAGDKEKALELLQKLKKDFPTSSPARDADKYISEYGS